MLTLACIVICLMFWPITLLVLSIIYWPVTLFLIVAFIAFYVVKEIVTGVIAAVKECSK